MNVKFVSMNQMNLLLLYVDIFIVGNVYWNGVELKIQKLYHVQSVIPK